VRAMRLTVLCREKDKKKKALKMHSSEILLKQPMWLTSRAICNLNQYIQKKITKKKTKQPPKQKKKKKKKRSKQDKTAM
jgi:ATP/ADP translocase